MNWLSALLGGSQSTSKHIIVGLGNPGAKYAKTRHNVGWLFLDWLAGDAVQWKDHLRLQARIATVSRGEVELLLVKPQAFMNKSGLTVAALHKKYPKDFLEQLVIVHDDKDLPYGTVKTERGRGAAGHNGVKSIIEQLGSKDFTRVRIGVANEQLAKQPTDRFVLSSFTAEEMQGLEEVFEGVEV